MVKMLQRRDDVAFDHFILILGKTGQGFIADKLHRDLQELQG
jgi:hypothetical protein